MALEPHIVYSLCFDFEKNEPEIPPDRGSIVWEDGARFRLVRHCWFLAERGNYERLFEDLWSLPWRLLGNLGTRVLGNHITTIGEALTYFWSEEESSETRRQSVMFRLSIECVIVVPADQHDGGELARRMIPADEAAINALEKVRVGDGEDECCCVCMEEMTPESEHRMMPCKHVYHEGCIVEWLKTSHVCPLCRFALPTR